jgi:hypothetical protein
MAAGVLDRHPGVGLLEDRDDLDLGELRLLHGTSWLGKHAGKFYFRGVYGSGKLTMRKLLGIVYARRRDVLRREGLALT